MSAYLVYGANGYTGELVAREAVARGHRPVLGGRNADALRRLGAELGLEHRAFALDAPPAEVDRGLEGVAAVLHCAGPFVHTWRPMAEACLRRKVHYLDITGEIAVFEALARQDEAARAAGVTLLPGAGFDVVPSDCLAAHLKRRLPSATRLALGFESTGRASRGTLTTMVENAGAGGAVRRGGAITPVPAAWRTREIDFGLGPRTAVTIPWGDVATAWHSTGIPDIEVYLSVPPRVRRGMLASRVLGPVLRLGVVRAALKARVRRGAPGPSAEARARSKMLLWGEVRDAAGGVASSRLQTPEGYTLTAATAVEIASRVAAGQAPAGFQTPSRVFGPDFILQFAGVTREDL